MKGEDLGGLLRSCRFKAGLTQVSLAQKLHCDSTYISKVENNEREPNFMFTREWVLVTGCQHFFVSSLMGQDVWEKTFDALDKLERIKNIITDPVAQA